MEMSRIIEALRKGRTGVVKPASRIAFLVALGAAAAWPGMAAAHPHIWADARVDLAISGNTVTALQHVWRFDDIFTATVLVEFDKNADNRLDDAELAEVGKTVRESIAEYDYFQVVQADGKDVAMQPPEVVIADYQDDRLLLIFESKMQTPLPLAGTLSFAVYDPTFYTAIDYANDTDMVSEGLPANCRREVIRPDPDEILAQNSQNLDEAFYETTDMTKLTGIFATRLQLTCGATQ
ncbi:ABC transporter substrate-binding protein [Zhengella mangrovi]|uniref:ABC transporter substrate-binding protein n=2 Tax=Zhengella mangrovi TaxID=1982044 RepID=A0A2G1QP48_9HYPH|nr:ABC transporter substrate-binding protein [Zhengella mangrovi]